MNICGTMQAHAPPPGYFVRLDTTSAQESLDLRKRVRMRRWLCCTCQSEEAYQSTTENERLKSPKNYADGILFLTLTLCLCKFDQWKK